MLHSEGYVHYHDCTNQFSAFHIRVDIIGKADG
jgi:hypothetical protein